MHLKTPYAAIITIGTEILGGKMDDTNATHISRWLKKNGVPVRWRISAEDSIDDISQVLSWTKDCAITILTGGLGPTSDDCTRDGLAGFLGRELKFNDKAWQIATTFYKERKIVPPESNKNQAFLIEGGTVIDNPFGTAPGMYCNDGDRHFFLLPGPPRENKPMLEGFVFDTIQSHFTLSRPEQITFRVYNAGESQVADLLKPLETELKIGSYFTEKGWLEMSLSLNGLSPHSNITLDDLVQKACTILIDAGFILTENRDLAEIIIETATAMGKKIAFAESITGGSCAEKLVAIPGASEVLQGSVVAYSNRVKSELLHVSPETLKKHGAVSEETVSEMVNGLAGIIDADIYAAVTGIAGPGGETPGKPVGLVWFGFLSDGKIETEQYKFRGSRSRTISRTVNHIFLKIMDILEYRFMVK